MKLIDTNKLNKFWKTGVLPIKNALTGKVDKTKVLNTKEEITANTSSDYAAGALPVKELINSLGGITFGVDSDGNYGYIKAGADTVTPFKSGNVRISQTFVNDTSGYRNATNYLGIADEELYISITISCVNASQGCGITINNILVAGGKVGSASWSGNLVKGDRIQTHTYYNNQFNVISGLSITVKEKQNN